MNEDGSFLRGARYALLICIPFWALVALVAWCSPAFVAGVLTTVVVFLVVGAGYAVITAFEDGYDGPSWMDEEGAE